MKINIENYENMTPEEKLAALEAYEPDMTGFVKKELLEKANSEAANYKKQLREKLSEDEAKKAQEAEEKERLLARLEELEHERSVNAFTTNYLGMGYDEKLAKSSAEALAKGDMDTVFKNQKAFIEAKEKNLRTELLKQTPPPPAGEGSKGIKKEDFTKLSLDEKQRFATENPEIYKELYKQ